MLGILLQLLIGPVGIRLIMADADRATAVPIALLAMATTPIGMVALDATTPDVARLLITLVAVGAFVAVLLPKQPEGHRPGRAAIAGTGLASMLLIFLGTAIAGTLAALWVGIATWRLFLLSVLLFPPMWLGNRIGARHFGSVPPRVWQTMVAVVLGVAAVSAVVRILN